MDAVVVGFSFHMNEFIRMNIKQLHSQKRVSKFNNNNNFYKLIGRWDWSRLLSIVLHAVGFFRPLSFTDAGIYTLLRPTY